MTETLQACFVFNLIKFNRSPAVVPCLSNLVRLSGEHRFNQPALRGLLSLSWRM